MLSIGSSCGILEYYENGVSVTSTPACATTMINHGGKAAPKR